MKIYSKKYPISLIEIVKRRVASYLLHGFGEKYTNSCPILAIYSQDHIGNRIQIDGIYEKPYLEILIDWIADTDKKAFEGVALDIGANIGNHSVFFSNFYNKVISFEPNPKIYSLLKINSLLRTNIEIHNIGISNKTKDSFMSSMKGNFGGSFVNEKYGDIQIVLSTLDSYVRSEEKVTLIKIDVEGHELKALQGCKNIITRDKPLIVFEQHQNDFKDGVSEVIEYLKYLGYSKFSYISDSKSSAVWGLGKIKKLFYAILRFEIRTIVTTGIIRPGFYTLLIATHG